MEFTPKSTPLFRSAMEGIREFLPMAVLRFTTAGLSVNGMNVSHTGFIDYFLSKDDCDTLQATEPALIGISMAVLCRALISAGADDKLVLKLNDAKDALVISYSISKAGKKALYTLPLMDIQEDGLEIPELSYASSVKTKTSDLVGIIKEAAGFDETIAFKLDEEGFHVTASGDNGKVTQTLENTEERDMTMGDEPVNVRFGANYITSIMKAGSPLSPMVLAEFDAEQPLRVQFLHGSASRLVCFLAPKID